MDLIKSEALKLSKQFWEFNKNNISPYHVVNNTKIELENNGFIHLNENDKWKLNKGQKYFVIRGHSSIISFTLPKSFDLENSSFKIIGHHVDSPCLRLAPKSNLFKNNVRQTCIQLYGGGLWNTWIDRELKLGGRVIINNNNKLETKLYLSEKSVGMIPNLCIHLRNDGNKMNYNYENNFRPIISSLFYERFSNKEKKKISEKTEFEKKHFSGLLEDISKQLNCELSDIVDFDLCFGDAAAPSLVGLNNDFITSARLDNVFSVFCATKSIIDSSENLENNNDICMSMGFDHEEIGSKTYVGACSKYLNDIMMRIMESLTENNEELMENYKRIISRSLILSCDMAHATHPNFEEYHQILHKPLINEGVVLKINANAKYTSDAMSQSIFRTIAKNANVPVQDFIVANDSRCGSTIGPKIASNNSLLSVDIGAPQFAMHSIRETCGVIDIYYYHKLIKEFYNNKLPKFD